MFEDPKIAALEEQKYSDPKWNDFCADGKAAEDPGDAANDLIPRGEAGQPQENVVDVKLKYEDGAKIADNLFILKLANGKYQILGDKEAVSITRDGMLGLEKFFRG